MEQNKTEGLKWHQRWNLRWNWNKIKLRDKNEKQNKVLSRFVVSHWTNEISKIYKNGVWVMQNYVEEVGDWVLCRMCLKKRSRSTETETNGDVAEPRLFDFMRVQSKGTRGSAGVRCSITSSSCSSSSGIAEVCSSVADHQETTGYTSSDS